MADLSTQRLIGDIRYYLDVSACLATAGSDDVTVGELCDVGDAEYALSALATRIEWLEKVAQAAADVSYWDSILLDPQSGPAQLGDAYVQRHHALAWLRDVLGSEESPR